MDIYLYVVMSYKLLVFPQTSKYSIKMHFENKIFNLIHLKILHQVTTHYHEYHELEKKMISQSSQESEAKMK